MQDTFENSIRALTFSTLEDHTLIIRSSIGLMPVGVFSARIKINGALFQSHYVLDNTGHPHGSLPFEQIMLSFPDHYACIKGPAISFSSESDCTIQGFITALTPKPKGNGNQFITIFLDQNSGKKSRISLCCGIDGQVKSLYKALTAIALDSNTKMDASDQRGWQ